MQTKDHMLFLNLQASQSPITTNISLGFLTQQERMWENRTEHGFASVGISSPPSWTLSLPSEPSQILQLQEPPQVFEGLPLADTIVVNIAYLRLLVVYYDDGIEDRWPSFVPMDLFFSRGYFENQPTDETAGLIFDKRRSASFSFSLTEGFG
ncbi:unnamed protein product [Eruca vesicaria subsp. sativa]|uniref:Uncharacterized protein n=1 Tax=Eruca vesicaria subsp. sativa TaxID=29727 RepID=A0ABC8LVJ1_ERUVS|nr:unnamed protein product [Eruca vesicaria subsp. sativa]